MTQNKINVPVLVGEDEELRYITVSDEQYKRILNGDQEILQKLVAEESEKSSATMIKETNFCDRNEDLKSMEVIKPIEDLIEESDKGDCDGKEAFTWPEKAVMLFLELYREREQEFTTGFKRHSKLWSEIAFELHNSNYNVSGVQVQNKMSSLKRTYKKIKDSSAKSGNHNSCWAFYSIMDSLFGDKTWVSPKAIASSDGPASPSELASSQSPCYFSSQSPSVDNSESQDTTSFQPKRRKVEVILDSFISDLKNNRDQIKEEKKKERLERDKRREQMWEIKRAEKREMHKETVEIQKSLISLLSKIVEKQNEAN